MKDKAARIIRLDRQSFLGADSTEVLSRCRVGIVGLGGGGSHICQQLDHLGVGEFALFDPDIVEETNLNRLVGATEEDVAKGNSKVSVAERLIRGVNPWARVEGYKAQWQYYASYVRPCDVVFGCVDGFIQREQLEAACRRFLIPYIDLGMDVTRCGDGFVISGQVAISMPGDLCMRCLGIITEDRLKEEAQRYGAAGGRPQVIWSNGVLASAAVGMFVKLVTPWEKRPQFPILLEYDGNAQTLLPSNKLGCLKGKRCGHFEGLQSVGDPFWKVTKEDRADSQRRIGGCL